MLYLTRCCRVCCELQDDRSSTRFGQVSRKLSQFEVRPRPKLGGREPSRVRPLFESSRTIWTVGSKIDGRWFEVALSWSLGVLAHRNCSRRSTIKDPCIFSTYNLSSYI